MEPRPADPTDAQGAKSLRQLAHDFRTPLSVICMGLEALKLVRHDERQFAEVLRMIVTEGTDQLKAMLAEMSAETAAPMVPPPLNRHDEP